MSDVPFDKNTYGSKCDEYLKDTGLDKKLEEKKVKELMLVVMQNIQPFDTPLYRRLDIPPPFVVNRFYQCLSRNYDTENESNRLNLPKYLNKTYF